MGAVAMLWVVTPTPVTEVARFDPRSITAPSLPPGTTSPTVPPAVLAEVRTVLWDGDSLAFDQAPAVVAALQAAGVTVVDSSQVGGRLTAYDDGRDPLGRLVAGFAADPADQPVDLVIHQLTVWDAAADPVSQQQALAALADLAAANGARLVLLTAPVVAPDMAEPGMADLVANAEQLAAASGGQVVVVDQTPVFGDEFAYDLDGDGVPERKPDGVHVCPSGAARVAAWLIPELAFRFNGIAVVPPSAWVEGPWSQDPRFNDPPGACMAR